MKTNNGFWIPATLATLFSLFLTNCTKDVTIPILTTNDVTEITETTATSGGSISSDGGAMVTERGVCWSTNPNPTIADFKTMNGTGAGVFRSVITGLSTETIYYVRAYATNSMGTGYGSEISFTALDTIFNRNISYGTMTDIDGNTYKTVTIGTQTWMAENLKVTKYNDGTSIPNVSENTLWASVTTGALCDYENTPSNSEIYGKMYNWFAVNTGKLAPSGWHVPSDEEFSVLENYLIANGYNYDNTTNDNKIAKALASSSGWENSTSIGSIGNNDYPEKRNASGFTALPAGSRYGIGDFSNIRFYAGWWSSTEVDTTRAYARGINNINTNVFRGTKSGYKNSGFAIRCIKN